ncbi:coiled-coil domain-containing protein 162-like [Bufo bufo]|uniref:coiled-coil domain-containing protein 162-like n=1 Tax=Bufo bufo TaxID=8384 RepID=UPI001ABE5948|nr:coiled-coil domain-containing protein 162-like [Bufo bufo]
MYASNRSLCVLQEEVEKVKRELVTDYCQKLSKRICTYSLRGQIIAYCNSLKQLLEEFPLICKTYFIIGHPQVKKTIIKEAPQADPRTFQERPHTLFSDDGRVFVNLWYIPYASEVLSMFKMLPEKAAYRALYQSLQIIAALHDIVSYILSFAQLGNSCSGYVSLINREMTADWGGTEGIGAELRDLQKLIDGLQNPHDPKEVVAMLLLRREVMILQFDAAVRYLIREALLSSGNISAFRTTTDNMYHGLTVLSNSVVKSASSSQLPVPQPHDPRSHRAFLLYPWRTFLADGGLFPLAIHGLHAIGYHMQLCLCDMTDQERSVAHGELVGVHLLMEDILQGKYNFSSFTVEGNLETKQLQVELFPIGEKQSLKTESKLESTSQDPISESTLLKAFLILWKQLEFFKEQWGKHKLEVEEINTVCLYRQFCELYRDEIFYPTMKAIAWQMGKEEEFEGLTLRSQVVLPPKGASEIEVRVRQLQKIMESFESDMIHDMQRKIAKEMTLLISERAREGRGVPTELWKKPVMKENFSPGRPQIIEKFVELLMSEHRGNSAEVTFSQEHLERCLTSLACDVMAREQSNFESYSMFYENLLQQEHQLLYQKEQELLGNKRERKKAEAGFDENPDMCHELIIEITALRTKLQDAEEEMMNSKETIKKQVQDEYEALVRSLFAACVSLKSRIDGYHINMNKQVTEIISDVRKEGVDDMILLKKKYFPGQNGSTLEKTLSMQEKLQDLRDENSQLKALVCKLKALNKWKITAKDGQLRERLRKAEKEAIQNKKEGLKLKLLVEQEVSLLRQRLMGARTALTKTQAESSKVKQQLSKQKQLLNESEHRHSQETRQRQQLDSIKSASMDKLLEDIEEKEHKLRSFAEETERSSKMGVLQQSKTKKEVKQIKSQLIQERCLKLDAFQRVDELQSQVYDLETSTSLRSSPGGMKKTSAPLASRASRSHSAAPALMSYETFHYNQEIWDPLEYIPSAEAKSYIQGERRLQRPKTVPSRCQGPNRTDGTSQAILTQLHELRLKTK